MQGADCPCRQMQLHALLTRLIHATSLVVKSGIYCSASRCTAREALKVLPALATPSRWFLLVACFKLALEQHGMLCWHAQGQGQEFDSVRLRPHHAPASFSPTYKHAVRGLVLQPRMVFLKLAVNWVTLNS